MLSFGIWPPLSRNKPKQPKLYASPTRPPRPCQVTPDHLSLADRFGVSPMQSAFVNNKDYLPIIRMLILRGAPIRPQGTKYSG